MATMRQKVAASGLECHARYFAGLGCDESNPNKQLCGRAALARHGNGFGGYPAAWRCQRSCLAESHPHPSAARAGQNCLYRLGCSKGMPQTEPNEATTLVSGTPHCTLVPVGVLGEPLHVGRIVCTPTG